MTELEGQSSILVIAGFAPSLTMFRGQLLNAMRGLGYQVTAAAPELTSNTVVAQQLAAMGIHCRDIPLMRTSINPLADLRLLTALVRTIRATRPQVVFAYTIKAVTFGLIAASIVGVQRRYALITGLGYAFTGEARGKRGLIRRTVLGLYRAALRQADIVFFQNRDDEALFRELRMVPARTPSVIVNGSGVDVAFYAPAPLPDGPLRFLLIARLLSTKGIHEYAEAAARIRADHPEVEFHLVGGIDSNPDAIPPGQAQRWNESGVLIWHGAVADVRSHIAACHVYVLPSYREGTPRSVLEAMAMGRAIITTDAPGCRETVSEGVNGLLVPPTSVDALLRAMERFILDPALAERMGQQSRRIAASKYDVHRVNRQMLDAMGLS